MSTFQAPPAILRGQANHDFFVANWPTGMQRASQIERQLLSLMSHPCYRLSVTRDAQGIERLKVQPSAGQPSPMTDGAREFARENRSDLIAWVKRTDADRARLQEVGLA